MRLTCTAVAALAAVLAGCGGAHHTTTGTTAATPPPARAPAAELDWPTYHANLARDGAVGAGPAAARTRRLWGASLDGAAYAEPLAVDGHVIAATENDSVYAFDASGRQQWRTHLGTPVAGADLPCGDIDPSGITSTPAVDRGTQTVYVVTFEPPAHHTLVALDLRSGAVRWRRAIDPPGADATVEQQRGALALAGGRVYIAYGGLYGDCGDYNGWVVAASATDRSSPLSSYRVPSARKGGIWAPSGPAIDAHGNLYVATGNGVSSSFDYGNAVIRLTPALARSDFFAPRNAAQLNGPDLDLGSVGPLLLPGGRLFAIGKDGVGYLVAAARLGGVGGELTSSQVCGGEGAFGGVAAAAGLVYVPCTSALVAIGAGDLALRWRGPGFAAGPPIVAGGAVWTVAIDQGALYALDPRNGRVLFHAAIGDTVHFATPASDGIRVYVGAGAHLLAFGDR